MAGVKFPSSFDVTGRFPLDSKFWVASLANLSDGEIYVGLHRWTLDTGKEYVYQQNNTWKDASNGSAGAAGTITIGNVTNGLLAKVINRGTISDAILDITLPKGDAGSTPIIDIGTTLVGNTPSVTNVGTPDRAILNFVIPASLPGTNGLDGKSVWFAYAENASGLNPAYTAVNKTFISIIAAYQQPTLNAFTNWIQLKGSDGINGKSTYIAYSTYSNGSGASFTLSTVHKYISIIVAVTQPLLTDFTTWVLFKGLDGGAAGASAYQTWLTLGNVGTEAQFIASLAGATGQSAYDIWKSLGNVGTPQQFIASITPDVNKAYVDAADGILRASIGTNTTNITTNTAAIGTIGTNVTTNTANIATNTSNIVTNTANIATNTQSIIDIRKPIQGRFTDGTRIAYATAQLAADALNAAGGGIITSQVDMQGPLVITGNVSIYAPGCSIYLTSGAGVDTLTLNSCTGNIECKQISRTGSGTGYALVLNGGNVVVKANTLVTCGYNAVFSNYGALAFYGNSELFDSLVLPQGERIVVLQVGGTLMYRGNITLTSDNNRYLFEGITAFGLAFVDFDGTINIVNKGRAVRSQGATFILRGRIITNDMGVLIARASADIYCSIDTRKSTSNAPALSAGQLISDASVITLHAGAELLSPPGIASITNAITNNPASVFVSGTLIQSAPPAADVIITYVTLQANTGPTTTTTSQYSTTALYAYLATVQYDTPAGYAGGIRFYRWNNPLDTVAAVRPAPVSSTNVFQGSWSEISASIGGTLYTIGGTNTNGAVTQKYTTETNAAQDTALANEVTARTNADSALQTSVTANTTAIGNKVDKVTGFGLSSNDYTTADKTRLASTLPLIAGTSITFDTTTTLGSRIINASSTSTGGTVTSASITTANGITGTVATPTTTPAITLTLGAITPSSVASTGAISGTNLSGTNTGDNASNTNYINDYRLTNFVAGTNYLAPNGSAAALVSFPTFNQSTTGNAATATNLTGLVTTVATLNNQSGVNTGDNATNTQYSGLATSKQDTLISATNIKSINGASILGTGDLTVTGITAATLASTITAATSKPTPVDADEIGITDSATSFSLKKLTWANAKATLKTYFDTIYTTTSAVSTQITTALTGYATQSYVTGLGYITNVVTALGYTPLNKAGDTITGDIGNTATGFFRTASGTTAQRPATPLDGMMRYSATTLRAEFYANGAWRNHARLEGDVFTGAISATNLSGTNTGDGPTAVGQNRKILKSDGTLASYQLQNSNDVIGGAGIYDTLALANAASELVVRKFGQTVRVTSDPTTANNGSYIVGSDNKTLVAITANNVQIIASFPLYAGSPTTWKYPDTVQYDAADGNGLQLYQVKSLAPAAETPAIQPVPRSGGVLSANWIAISPSSATSNTNNSLLFTMGVIPATTVTATGAFAFALPSGATQAFDVGVIETANGTFRDLPNFASLYSVANGTISFTVGAELKANDVIVGSYYGNAAAQGQAVQSLDGRFRGTFSTAIQYNANDLLISPATAFPPSALVAATGLTAAGAYNATNFYDPVANKLNIETAATLTYGAAITLDFTGATARDLVLAGNITFGGTVAVGRVKNAQFRIFIINPSASTYSLTFPSSWRMLGVPPTSILAGKGAIMTVESRGVNETDVWCGLSSIV